MGARWIIVASLACAARTTAPGPAAPPLSARADEWPSAERWPAPELVERAPPPCRRTVGIADSAGLPAAIAGAQAGDCLELADGDYTFPVITKVATEAAPVVIRAAHRGKAVVTSGRLVLLDSAYVVIEGLVFTAEGNVQILGSHHCRLTRCRIRPAETKDLDWIVVERSHHVRLDHNELGPKRLVGNMIMLEGDARKVQVVQFLRIDHNHFHDIAYGGGNGWEAIRAGRSWLAPSRAFTVIEHNLFRNTGGDPEVLSVKSSDNVVRYNTMRSSPGQFTLRHGNRNWVYGNHLLGEGVRSAGGIRMYGADHQIFGNHLDHVSPGIRIDAGSRDGTDEPGTAHYRVYRARVFANTFVESQLEVGGSKALPPVDCAVFDNVFHGGRVVEGGQNTVYVGKAGDVVVAARGPLTEEDVGPDAP